MKKSILLLTTIASLALSLALTTNAATQVYDLKTDWSDTQNPNGTWSYLFGGDNFLRNDPFPWTSLGNALEGIIKLSEATSIPDFSPITPGYLEIGDIYVLVDSDVRVRWTAPAKGTINVSGTVWCGLPPPNLVIGAWTLTHNDRVLSSGDRLSDFLSGSGGTTALQNIVVHTGDKIELAFIPEGYGAMASILQSRS